MDLFELYAAKKLSGGGGGGGSSDFSTAQVTFVSQLDEWYCSPIIPFLYDNDEWLGTCVLADNSVMNSENLSPYTAVLYKGVCKGSIYTEQSVSVSGDATFNDGAIVITGDCTITIS